MKESPVEKRLKSRLESIGCLVLKLTTPGYIGTPDRMILRPKWSPGPPWVVECKRPGKTERRAQELVAEDWTARGILVLGRCDSYERVEEIYQHVFSTCRGGLL